MKRINHLISLTSQLQSLLVLAVVSLISVVLIFQTQGCIPPPGDDEGCFNLTDSEEARVFNDRYLQSLSYDSPWLDQTWTIDLCHVEAMNYLFDLNEAITGFLFYPGLDETQDHQYLFISGLLEGGSGTVDEWARTPRGNSFFCPPFCDIVQPDPYGGLDYDIQDCIAPGHTCTYEEALPLIASFVSRERKTSEFYGAHSFRVSLEQYLVIKQILDDYPDQTISGFRFFMGSTAHPDAQGDGSTQDLVMLVCTMDNEGNVNQEMPVFITSIDLSGLCPRFCD